MCYRSPGYLTVNKKLIDVSTNRFHLNGNTIPSTIHSPPPPHPPLNSLSQLFFSSRTWFFGIILFLVKIFSHAIMVNQKINWYRHSSVGTWMCTCSWSDFNFTKPRTQYSYYLFVDLSASVNGSESSDVTAAGANCGEYLKLAKKGGGHDGEI